MKLKGEGQDWEDKLLPKIPSNEIYKDLDHTDSNFGEKQANNFRARALTIGNGQITRLSKHANEADSSDPTEVLKKGMDINKIKVEPHKTLKCKHTADIRK